MAEKTGEDGESVGRTGVRLTKTGPPDRVVDANGGPGEWASRIGAGRGLAKGRRSEPEEAGTPDGSSPPAPAPCAQQRSSPAPATRAAATASPPLPVPGMLRPAHPSLAELEHGFRKAARAGSAQWPAEAAQAAVAAGPARQRAVFASAGRACGHARIAAWPSWTCDDAARLLLLDVFVGAVPAPDAAALLRRLYDRGDAHERRAVLRALPYLPTAAASVALTRSLAQDALRTNDHRLVAAALGPCGYALEPAAWRQGVLKCVVLGLPLTAVTGLDDRADRELGSMLDDFAREREAAGRSVPPEIAPLAALARES